MKKTIPIIGFFLLILSLMMFESAVETGKVALPIALFVASVAMLYFSNSLIIKYTKRHE